MRRLSALLSAVGASVLAVAVLTGCEALVANAAMDFTITLEPSEVTAERGSEFEVTVVITRPVPVGVIPTPIEVTLHDGPDFVSAEALEIPSGITEDEMTFVLAGDAPLGEAEETVELRATNGFKTKEVTFTLTVVDGQ